MADTTAVIRTAGSAEGELDARIDGFVRLGANWDGEDAAAISEETAGRTKALVREVFAAARSRRLTWRNPTATPNADGGIDLSWQAGGRWVMLTVSPGSAAIECARQQDLDPPAHREQAVEETVETALWPLAGAQ